MQTINIHVQVVNIHIPTGFKLSIQYSANILLSPLIHAY